MRSERAKSFWFALKEFGIAIVYAALFIVVGIAIAAAFWGCVDVQKGAFQIGPESLGMLPAASGAPSASNVPRETPSGPEGQEPYVPAWWASERLWGGIGASIAALGGSAAVIYDRRRFHKRAEK